MAENEDYLVVGRPERYGVLNVAGCSGTQPLKTAHVSLRTLDGSHCAAPGGTIIGQVLEGRYPNPVPNVAVTLRNSNGDAHTARTDKDGVYELRNLPRGHYSVDSRFDSRRYASGFGTVRTGVCADISIHLKPYSLTGRLTPGAADSVALMQAGVLQKKADFASNGRFYFDAVAPGEYQLAATVSRETSNQRDLIYFPGVRDQRKARPIRVPSAGLSAQSLDFDPTAFPQAPILIPIVVEAPGNSTSPERPVVIYIHNSAGCIVSQIYGWTEIPTSVPGVLGHTYGFSVFLTDENMSCDGPFIYVKAAPAMKTVRLHLGATSAAPPPTQATCNGPAAGGG
jgi:hypothetical protein